MVFPYMDHDLCGLLANTAFSVTQSLAKLLLRQILEGLAYIHSVSLPLPLPYSAASSASPRFWPHADRSSKISCIGISRRPIYSSGGQGW